jgi:hypothetical protein
MKFNFSNNHWGHGVRDVQCPTGAPVTTNSIVLASATEVFWDQRRGLFVPFQGAASIQVLNCVPRPDDFPGAVYVRVNILWNSDILIRVSGVIF